MTDPFILRKHLAFRKGHYLLGQKQTASFIIWPFHWHSPELWLLPKLWKGRWAALGPKGNDQKTPALNHRPRNSPPVLLSCLKFFTKSWKGMACNIEVIGKKKVSGTGWVVTVGKREVMCLCMEKENISGVPSFSSLYWFSFYWDTGKGPPVTSIMCSYPPQPLLIGPSGYLSQVRPISSLPQDCWVWDQRGNE